jgi:hypothetical protein
MALTNKIKKYMTINNMIKDLKERIKKNGLQQLKAGGRWKKF